MFSESNHLPLSHGTVAWLRQLVSSVSINVDADDFEEAAALAALAKRELDALLLSMRNED